MFAQTCSLICATAKGAISSTSGCNIHPDALVMTYSNKVIPTCMYQRTKAPAVAALAGMDALYW